MPVRRSLQAPDPDGCYLTKGHNVTCKIEQAIKKDDHGELRDMAMEIGIDWGKEDNAGRVRLAIFGCEILLLLWPHHQLIDKGFLNREIELLCKLEGKLLRGVNPSRREREFVKALRGGLHDEWLKAIRWQAKKVLEKTEP
ncbi:uncharacterized protein FOBCDRAFT_212876 [Fusarium oxysporum Fo47]|uniref:uncharacterized protein n=1 Tax=Fusarium oxysporum Fo47 TaxID=660027 RepID=UPI00159A79F0|nr:uncharacterized protein FOBCDRAFT_212876 [Fusarium oxysporum Fo47]QKD47989.1 hypothetical protein FOBCDRAFT_212876 [Fusarium oxysporum Fo47]